MIKISYKGTPVFFEFPSKDFDGSSAFKDRQADFHLGIPLQSTGSHIWLRGHECIIDSAREKIQLGKLSRRIRQQDKKELLKTFELIIGDHDNKTISALNNYAEFHRTYMNLEDKLYMKQVFEMFQILGVTCIKKKIKKLHECLQIARLKLRKGLSLKGIASNRSLSLTRVSYLWTQIRRTHGLIFNDLINEIHKAASKRHYLKSYVDSEKFHSMFRENSLRKSFIHALTVKTENIDFTFDDFYKEFKDVGFRYQSIRYSPHQSKIYDTRHLESFIQVFLYFVLSEDRFETLFVDESSVCPSNFKKMAWRKKGDSLVQRSKIKYEKVMILASMSHSNIHATQVIHSSFSSLIFLNFIISTLRNITSNSKFHKQVVIFLDNCGAHRSDNLRRFCQENNVILFYNLPRQCQLNPIEFLWEYVKRNLRQAYGYRK